MYNFVIWALSKISKAKILKLIWKVCRKAFGRLYSEVVIAVRAAEEEMPNGTGAEKAAWVAKTLYESHNELKEWRWVINILIEAAVGEVKDYTDSPARLSKFTGVK
jgi:hypothetical protein